MAVVRSMLSPQILVGAAVASTITLLTLVNLRWTSAYFLTVQHAFDRSSQNDPMTDLHTCRARNAALL